MRAATPPAARSPSGSPSPLPSGGVWTGAPDAGPSCPLCLKPLKTSSLAAHLAAAGHSAHDAACGRCHKHFSTFEALTEHLWGAALRVAAAARGRAEALRRRRCRAAPRPFPAARAARLTPRPPQAACPARRHSPAAPCSRRRAASGACASSAVRPRSRPTPAPSPTPPPPPRPARLLRRAPRTEAGATTTLLRRPPPALFPPPVRCPAPPWRSTARWRPCCAATAR